MTLLGCTLKKSTDVAKKWLYVFAVCAAITIVGYIWTLVYEPVVAVGVAIGTWIAAVPLWIIIPAVAIIALVGYSFLWCVSKELTGNDWSSDSANVGAAVVFMGSAFIWVLGWIIAAMLCNMVMFALTILPICALVLSIDNNGNTCRVAEFPGAAWNHYVVVRKNE